MEKTAHEIQKERIAEIEAKAAALLDSVCYFFGGDIVTLIGNVEFVEDRATQETVWNESDRCFFSKGIDDPKFRLLHFHTIEATFGIEGKFRTCRYK